MRKISVLFLVFCSFASFADGLPSMRVQPYPEYLAAYIKTLITTGCEQTLKDGTEQVLIEKATKGMKKDTSSYYTVHNAIVLGAGFGKRLKEKGKLITKEKSEIDSCGRAATYTMMQKDFMEMVVADLVNLEQSQAVDEKP